MHGSRPLAFERLHEETVELVRPHHAGLLEPVRGLVQSADGVLLVFHDESVRLLHVDVLFDRSVEVRAYHIDLMQRQAVLRWPAGRGVIRDGQQAQTFQRHRCPLAGTIL